MAQRQAKLEDLRIPSCVPKAERSVFQVVQSNFSKILSPIVNAFQPNTINNIENGGPTFVYNIENVFGQLPTPSSPVWRVQLTSAMSGQECTAKLYKWNGAAYAVTGDDFPVYDIFDRWSHASSGEKGVIQYDADRDAWSVVWLDTLLIRRVSFSSGTLNYNGSVTIGGRVIYGDNLVNAKKVVGGSGITLTICYDHGDKKWYALTVNKCAVTA